MLSNRLVLPAPAKLNLFLHIIGQRSDGYHLLQTIFQFVDYGDQIRLTSRMDHQIRRTSHLQGVPEQDDLVIQAAILLRQYCMDHGITSSQGVDIYVEKTLPMGGGLGGGSSDAATVLHGLNYLWQCGLNDEQLAQLGVQLGADVPIFIHGNAAWAEGIGEQFQAIELDEPWFFILNPRVSVPTAQLFSHKDLTRDCEIIKIPPCLKGDIESLNNVFEPLVCQQYPEVQEALNWLSQFAVSRMTGSGSCLYASFKHKKDADIVLEKLPKKWEGFVAKGNNTSLLKQALQLLS